MHPMRDKTSQEQLWEGAFGAEYTTRNAINPKDREPFFQHILRQTSAVQRVCELGANRGHNLLALQGVQPELQLTGVEINPEAHAELSKLEGIQAVHTSILDLPTETTYDLVFTCGVLIHLPPEALQEVYRKIFDLSNRYILINEYYNPTPVEIPYREHRDSLFKRDFGTEFLAATAPHTQVLNYGFLWQTVHPSWDNTTWWLFEKSDKS